MWAVKEVFTYSRNAITSLHISVMNINLEEHFIQNVICRCFQDRKKMKKMRFKFHGLETYDVILKIYCNIFLD